MKKQVIDMGSFVTISLSDNKPVTALPPRVYTPGIKDGMIILNKDRSHFEVPNKIYGNKLSTIAKTIMRDHKVDAASLGVMMLGRKGMGKSLLSEILANAIIDKGLPVIMISTFFPPELISTLLNQVGPCAVIFEEFSLNYDWQTGPKLVPVLSDTDNKGVLFIINSNEANNGTLSFIIDRPQRCKYRINFGDMDENTMESIITDFDVRDELKDMYRGWATDNKVNIDSLITFIRMSKDIESPEELVEYMAILNIPTMNEGHWKLSDVTINGSIDYPFIISQLTNRPSNVIICIDGEDNGNQFNFNSNRELNLLAILDGDEPTRDGNDTFENTILLHNKNLFARPEDDSVKMEEFVEVTLHYVRSVAENKGPVISRRLISILGKVTDGLGKQTSPWQSNIN